MRSFSGGCNDKKNIAFFVCAWRPDPLNKAPGVRNGADRKRQFRKKARKGVIQRAQGDRAGGSRWEQPPSWQAACEQAI